MSSNITLPVSLPFKLGDSNIIKGKSLPTVLPFSLRENGSTVGHDLKVKTIERAQTVELKYLNVKTTETPWVFTGIIIEENVISKKSKPLTITEDVRSLILTNLSMQSKNELKVEWYGDRVPTVEVYVKESIDEDYKFVKECEWEETYTLIELGNNEYDIKLLGSSSSGESSAINIGYLNDVNIDTKLNLSINEKSYQFHIDFCDKYKIDVNM